MASWKPIFDAVLDLYDDVSTLLRDLDFQLDRSGYGCIHARHYGYEGTAALDRPRAWLPTWLSRLYVRQSEQSPRRFLTAAVVLHPEGLEVLNPNWVEPQAPLLLGSMVRYSEPPHDRWELRHGLLWLQSDAPMDGTIHRVTLPPGVGGAAALIEYADVMALPLEVLRTGDDLRSLVLDPLRRLI
jgi:hypothetical protein